MRTFGPKAYGEGSTLLTSSGLTMGDDLTSYHSQQLDPPCRGVYSPTPSDENTTEAQLVYTCVLSHEL